MNEARGALRVPPSSIRFQDNRVDIAVQANREKQYESILNGNVNGNECSMPEYGEEERRPLRDAIGEYRIVVNNLYRLQRLANGPDTLAEIARDPAARQRLLDDRDATLALLEQLVNERAATVELVDDTLARVDRAHSRLSRLLNVLIRR